jgi:hypothetical protein
MSKKDEARIKIVKSANGVAVLTEWATIMKEFESHEDAVEFAKLNDPDDWGQIWDAIVGDYLPKGKTGITNVNAWDGEKFYLQK